MTEVRSMGDFNPSLKVLVEQDGVRLGFNIPARDALNDGAYFKAAVLSLMGRTWDMLECHRIMDDAASEPEARQWAHDRLEKMKEKHG